MCPVFNDCICILLHTKTKKKRKDKHTQYTDTAEKKVTTIKTNVFIIHFYIRIEIRSANIELALEKVMFTPVNTISLHLRCFALDELRINFTAQMKNSNNNNNNNPKKKRSIERMRDREREKKKWWQLLIARYTSYYHCDFIY